MAAMMRRMRRRRRIDIGYRTYSLSRRLSLAHVVILFILVLLALYIGSRIGSSSQIRDNAYVTSVVDGDTFHARLDNGTTLTIRLLGMDTPETHHPTKPVGCYGPEASYFSMEKLTYQHVVLEYDTQRYDKYGRTLAYVYLNKVRFNDVLVRNGYARTLTIEPNHKYAHQLLIEEKDAEKNMRGLWKACEN